MKLTFALALNEDGVFENKHFGDADTFAFYSENNNEIQFVEQVSNHFKTPDKNAHGSVQKGKAVVSFLKEKSVNVLISKQFGKNIKIVNQYFIPVIINESTPDDVMSIIKKHKNWLKDELQNREKDYMLFHIKNGIFKSKITPSKNILKSLL